MRVNGNGCSDHSAWWIERWTSRPLSSIRATHVDFVAASARDATMFRQLARVYVGVTFPSLDPTESTLNATERSRLERSVVWIGDEHAAGLNTAYGRAGEWHPGGARLRLPTRDERVTSVANLTGVLDVGDAAAVEVVVFNAC